MKLIWIERSSPKVTKDRSPFTQRRAIGERKITQPHPKRTESVPQIATIGDKMKYAPVAQQDRASAS